MQIEFWQFVASTVGAWGALGGAFGVGFTVGRSRGKTEAYADIATKKKKGKKHGSDGPASTLSYEPTRLGASGYPEP